VAALISLGALHRETPYLETQKYVQKVAKK
jgi:hypothetical protein